MQPGWKEAATGILFMVLGLAFLVSMVRSCLSTSYDRGACEARGGVYVAGGIEVDGRLVRCIAPPTEIEIPEMGEER